MAESSIHAAAEDGHKGVVGDEHEEGAHSPDLQVEPVNMPAEAVDEIAQHDTLSETEQAALRDYEEDFRLWEEELRTAGPEVGVANMQMGEDVDEPEPQAAVSRTRSVSSSQNSHAPRTAPSLRSSEPVPVSESSEAPTVATGGGGGNVPPVYRARPSYEQPEDFPHGATPNTAPTSKRIDRETHHEHSHEHGHPRLAFAMAAGLLVEHMLGKRADRRIEKAGRARTDKLSEQIKRSQTTQEQARQQLEARQLQLEAEQARQRQTLESVGSASNTAAASKAERVSVPRRHEELTPPVDSELQQMIEQGAATVVDAEASARSKVAMEQAAVAAELDQPVERVYERRQEVKDEPSNPAGAAAGGAASIGSVPSTSNSAQQRTIQGASGSTGQRTNDGHAHDPGIDFHAAAVRGVGAGLAVIVLALLAYLLF